MVEVKVGNRTGKKFAGHKGKGKCKEAAFLSGRKRRATEGNWSVLVPSFMSS
jgi:hypothetical protein